MKVGTYLKEQRRFILFTAGNAVLFSAVLLLYHITLRAVVYPVILSGVILSVYLAADFQRKKQRIRLLQDAMSGVEDALPEPESEVGRLYQDYICQLQSTQKELTMKQDLRYQDMIDYYTTWAHQIKTPIAAMRLKLQNEDSALSRQLSADLLRTEQYVDMVMVYLRLDAPANDYVLKRYTVDGMVKKSVRVFASEFIRRGLSLELGPLEGSLITDEKWFCFVLEQLLSNALKYTRSGGISIRMEGEDLLIADTGIGIAAEDLPRIFQKGYTGFNGRRDRHASGLGLYLSKRICDGLNISISASSQPGRGSVFMLKLSQYSLTTE